MALPDTVSTEELASLVGLSGRRIRQLADEGILPKSDRNEFKLTVSVLAFLAYREAQIRAEFEAANPNAADYEKERARLTRSKADKAEIEADLLKGTVHESSAVAAVMNEMLASFRQRVLVIPTKTAPLTADCSSTAECYSIIEKECHEALGELADYDPRPVVERQRAAAAKPEEDEIGD